jgi:hypothetical protein
LGTLPPKKWGIGTGTPIAYLSRWWKFTIGFLVCVWNDVTNRVIRIVEQEVCEYYAKKLEEPMFLAVGYFKDYDSVSLSRQLKIEVKFEEKARDTLNLAFEVSYNGTTSGLAATKANTWVHVIPIDRERMSCLEFDVSTLREATRNLPSYWGGDGKRSELKLLPVSEAWKIATRKFELVVDWTGYLPYWD